MLANSTKLNARYQVRANALLLHISAVVGICRRGQRQNRKVRGHIKKTSYICIYMHVYINIYTHIHIYIYMDVEDLSLDRVAALLAAKQDGARIHENIHKYVYVCM